MKLLKKVVLGYVVILILGLVLFSLKASQTKAQEDNVNLHIKVEASTDKVNWKNYSGTESPDGESIVASPGDKVYMRIKVWNSDIFPAANISGIGLFTITSSGSAVDDYNDYVDRLDIINTDRDNDGIDFNGFIFDSGGAGTLSVAEPNVGEGDAEIMTGSMTLSDNIPVGKTVILGQGRITNYILGVAGNNSLIGIAKAEGMGKTSGIRIVVNTQPEELPAVGMPLEIYLGFFGLMISASLTKVLIEKRRKI